MHHRICVNDGALHYVLSVDVHKDGDLMVSVPTTSNEPALLLKVKIPSVRNRTRNPHFKVPYEGPDSVKIITLKPKLSFHLSGWMQVSGDGIRSGFDSGVPKGVATMGYRLSKEKLVGDEGFRRILTMGIWGLEKKFLKNPKSKDQIIFQADEINQEKHVGAVFTAPKKSYILELFCLPNEAMMCSEAGGQRIRFIHPGYGRVKLRYISHIGDGSIFIAMLCTQGLVDFNTDYGYTIGMGPSIEMGVGSEAYFEQINILFPGDAGPPGPFKTANHARQ